MDKEGRIADIKAMLTEITSSHSDEENMTALDILLKLIGNILKYPKDEKYRTIKKSNKAIANKLLNIEGMHEFLLNIHYEDDSDDTYQFDIHNFTDLAKAKHAIQDVYDDIRVKYMTAEELEKYLLLKEQKKEFEEELKEKEKMKKEIESRTKLDRSEKKTEEVKSSKANYLGFGAQVKKFEPPCPPRRWG